MTNQSNSCALRSFFSLAIAALVLGACNPQGIEYTQTPGKGGKGGTGTMATVSESDYNKDTQNLKTAESGLAPYGLKFQSRPGTTDVVWDNDFQTSFNTQNPDAKPADAVPALKTFSKTANEYMKKYGAAAFHLTHKDGTDEIKKLDPTAVANLTAQIALAKAELAKRNPKGK